MNIKRELAVLAAIAITAAGLVSCGDSTSSTAALTTTTNAASVPADTNSPAETESTADPASDAESTAETKEYERIFTADKAKIKYNGAEIAVGSKIDDIKGSLGAEAAPSTDAPSCLTGNTIKEYYYAGMTIQANNDGTIFSITLSNDLYSGGDGTTADGVKLGDDADAVKTALGKPDEEKKTNLIYKDGTVTLQVTVSKKGADVIWVSDSSVEN
ncbi:MAG: hypothetical protein IKP47_02980 [Ruminococcus sp.]|nr:hypothetical protein [Ruminococcus sp.]